MTKTAKQIAALVSIVLVFALYPMFDRIDDHPKSVVILFGVTAATVTATATFARLGKARVVPFTQTRLADGQGYLLRVHPPLENFPEGDELADALRINQWVEQQILLQPEQYMWVHRRFKTRPEGEARPYPQRRRKKRRNNRRS